MTKKNQPDARIPSGVRVLGLMILGSVAGCASLPGYVHPSFKPEQIQDTRKVFIAPLDMQFFEISAGGVPEKVKGWGDQANTVVLTATREELRRRTQMDAMELPDLDEAERRALERATAMFRRVADQIAAVKESNDESWTKRAHELEFTIGNELRPLARRVGADAILFVDGMDYVSSIGRRIMFVVTTLVFGLPVLPPGTSYLQAGLVDLNSGEVLWFGRDYSVTLGDLREAGTAAKLVGGMFASYPETRTGPRQ